MCIFAGHKAYTSGINDLHGTHRYKYYAAADAIIECDGGVLMVDSLTKHIYAVSCNNYWGLSMREFPLMTWGGYRKMDDDGHTIKSVFYAEDDECVLHYDDEVDWAYIRTDSYRGYTNDSNHIEEGPLDVSIRHDLIKVWVRG